MQGNNNVKYMALWHSDTLFSQNLMPCHKKRNTALDNTRKSGDVLVVRNNLPEVGPFLLWHAVPIFRDIPEYDALHDVFACSA